MSKAKVYHLGNCKTCQKIIAQLPEEKIEFQEIKTTPITADQLDYLKEKVGSYEALFSRRAMKYRSMGLQDQQLTEEDYRKLIIEEYTFLKRPVIVVGDEVFVGSAKKNVEAALNALETSN